MVALSVGDLTSQVAGFCTSSGRNPYVVVDSLMGSIVMRLMVDGLTTMRIGAGRSLTVSWDRTPLPSDFMATVSVT